jgi:hypothetical protein
MYAVLLAVSCNATTNSFFMTFYKTFDMPVSPEYMSSHLRNRSCLP